MEVVKWVGKIRHKEVAQSPEDGTFRMFLPLGHRLPLLKPVSWAFPQFLSGFIGWHPMQTLVISFAIDLKLSEYQFSSNIYEHSGDI